MEISEGDTAKHRIKKCFASLQESLDLSNKQLRHVPVELSKFTWVSELKLNDNNIQILENLPPNLESLECNNCYIDRVNFNTLPKKLTKLSLVNCGIKSIAGIHVLKKLEILDVSKNKIKVIPVLPDNLIRFVCNDSGVESISDYPEGIEIIMMNDNNLKTYGVLPDSVLEVYFKDNQLVLVDNLPPNLHKLDMSDNVIDKVTCRLPSSLDSIDFANNNIITLPDLPDGLTHCILSKNNIKMIMDYPEELLYLDVSNNELTYIPPGLEKKIPYFDASNNCVEKEDDVIVSDIDADIDADNLNDYISNKFWDLSPTSPEPSDTFTTKWKRNNGMSHNMESEITRNEHDGYYIIPEDHIDL